MKILFSYGISLLFLTMIAVTPVILHAEQEYLYCGRDRSKLADLIEQVSAFDEDRNSPVWQLRSHIISDFPVATTDSVLQVLEYVEEKLDYIYRNIDAQQAEEMYTHLSDVMRDIQDGVLTIDEQFVDENQTRDCCGDSDSDIIKVRQKLYVLKTAKFFKDVEFKENVEIEGNLSVAEETINCDLTVGCNINMNNSAGAFAGNILKGGLRFVSNFGIRNTFMGTNAGNFVMSGTDNSGFGSNAFTANTAGSNNTAVGSQSLLANTAGTSNTAVGAGALQLNVVGNANTAVGVNSLQNNAGDNNTAIGFSTLTSNTAGTRNTAMGRGSLNQNTTGSDNTALGDSTLVTNLGNDNTAVGSAALNNNTFGINGAAVGSHALAANTIGSANAAFGAAALQFNVNGTGNTAVGFAALNLNPNGSFNTAIGQNAGALLTNGSSNIYIANLGVATESNTIRIGALGTQTAAYMQGIFGSTVAIGGLGVEVDASGKLGTIVSSFGFKKNIQDMDTQSEKLRQLRPVTFEYKNDESNTRQIGLIAEEVAKVFPELVVNDLEGQPYSIRYQILPVLLLQELQKQQDSIDMLIDRVTVLEELVGVA